ncbi:MAG: sulfurtransferase TusA family protein [bacterium]
MRFYEIPETLSAEEDQFEKDLLGFATGDINPVKFKAIRVAHGVYEQRQEHTYMIRIRCAAGGITPVQLKKVAELGQLYGSSEVHFTTRQEVQVHNVLIQDVMKVIRGLRTVGLSSKGGGGNTIRNILTSANSGVDPDEVFDVDPYAIALTSRMISEGDSWNLPRKFKIAFSNGPKDTSYTQATCLGFVATMKEGQKGFSVYCAGGMGAKPMVGHLLMDFVPDVKIYQVTKALKVMFDKHGNRRSKYSSRLKFLWKKLDREEFVRLFKEEYTQLVDDRSLDLEIVEIDNKAEPCELTPLSLDSMAFELWKKRYVFVQKQSGLVSVKLPLLLGDLLSKDAELLCDFLAHFGDNCIRCDRDQNMRLRNIPELYLPNLFQIIEDMQQTLADRSAFIGNMINCTGAQTCKLGICLPRGLSVAIHERLAKGNLNLDALSDFRLNMSGCPNTCGMHHVADLGFFGKISRKEGQLYPAYYVLAGAKTGEGKTEYAKKMGEVASHYIPDFVYAFLEDYLEQRDDFKDYHDYLEQEGVSLIKSLCEQYKEVPTLQEDKRFYIDHGAKRPLSLDEMGTAECSAGMFDMINVDRKSVELAKKELEEASYIAPLLYNIMFHSSRMLLVTRGLDAKNEEQCFSLFAKHFVTAGLIEGDFMAVLDAAKKQDEAALIDKKEQVLALADSVEGLYKSMDDSLRFKVEPNEQPALKTVDQSEVILKDYRGVGCPMNFVKAKLVLETLATGALMDVLLDDGEPIENVPNSLKLEGHKILVQQKETEGHWLIRVQKG